MSESSEGNRIVCRQCGEVISVNAGNCPHCGTGVRSRLRILGVLVLGIGVLVLSIIGIFFRNEGGLWFFAIIGIATVIVSYVFYDDRRDRVEQAAEESEEAS